MVLGWRNNIELWRPVALAVGLLCLATSGVLAGEVITPKEAFDRQQKGELVLIDIRRPSEWRDTGTPAGAILLTMHRDGGIEDFISEIDRRLGREKPIALICAGGVRSRYLQWRLGQFGLEDIIDVSEGVVGSPFSKGWRGRDLPMTPYPEEPPSSGSGAVSAAPIQP